jgi:hypothetical protein
MLDIRPLAFDRVVPVAAELWAADREELEAAGIHDAAAMLLDAVPLCSWAEEARWNGATIAVFGVRPLPGGEIGVPWMLCTFHMEQAEKAAVARAAVRAVSKMRAEFHTLMNLVHAKNLQAQRFVHWLGFDVDPTPVGPGGEFRRFTWKRHV